MRPSLIDFPRRLQLLKKRVDRHGALQLDSDVSA